MLSRFPTCRKKKGPVDCLGRTKLHQHLDSDMRFDLKAGENEYDFKEDINTPDVLGRTPLHIACAKNQQAGAVEWLLKHGAHSNSATDTGATPLHLAAVNGNESLCKLLIKSPDVQMNAIMEDEFGCKTSTALHLAVSKRHHYIVRLLANHPNIEFTGSPDIFIHAAECEDGDSEGASEGSDGWLCHARDGDGRGLANPCRAGTAQARFRDPLRPQPERADAESRATASWDANPRPGVAITRRADGRIG